MQGPRTLPSIPFPEQGESLSGYIVRLAAANHIGVSDILFKIRNESATSFEQRTYHQIDSSSETKISLKKLSEITGIETGILANMSFMPLYIKFVSDEYLQTGKPVSIIRFKAECNHRRFCPVCVSENRNKNIKGLYKLVWQFDALELCNIHNSKITSKCLKCGAEQDYLGDNLIDYKCCICGEPLENSYVESQLTNEYIQEQKRVYKYYEYLLDFKQKALNRNEDMAYEYRMLLTLLYLLYQNTNKKDKEKCKFNFMSKDERLGAIAFFKKRKSDAYVTPYMLYKYLRRVSCDVGDFFRIKYSDDFVKSFSQYYGINGFTALCRKKPKVVHEVHHRWKDEDAIDKINNYIRNIEDKTTRLTCAEIYKGINISQETLSAKVSSYVRESVDSFNMEVNERLLAKINYAIHELMQRNEGLTYKNIANETGISIMYMKRHPEAIRTIIQSCENDTL